MHDALFSLRREREAARGEVEAAELRHQRELVDVRSSNDAVVHEMQVRLDGLSAAIEDTKDSKELQNTQRQLDTAHERIRSMEAELAAVRSSKQAAVVERERSLGPLKERLAELQVRNSKKYLCERLRCSGLGLHESMC